MITNDILIFIFNRWQPKYGPGACYEIPFPNRTSSPLEPGAVPGTSRGHDTMHDRATLDHPPLDTSDESEDTLITEGMYSCQSLTNGFALQNGIGTGEYREHTFLIEIRRNNISYAKCMFCTKEIEIEKHTMSNLFLSCYTHMSCALYDEKIHILQDMESVEKIREMNIQVRKILMGSNMGTNSANWDPSVIISVMKPGKKCRLLDLPRMK